MRPEHAAVEWTIAGLFVVSHAWRRFNLPPTNRASTTAARYHAVLAIYIVVNVFWLVLIGLSPRFLGEILTPALANLLSHDAKKNGAPFFGALFVTVLLPMIPVLAELDEGLRRVLQEIAAIPFQAVTLSKRLRAADMKLNDRVIAEVTDLLIARGFDRGQILFTRDNSLQYMWTRISVLMFRLRSWDESDRRLAAFCRAFHQDFERLGEAYDRVSGLVTAISALPSTISDAKAQAAVQELRKSLKDQLLQLHKDLCVFISRGVLKCRFTDAARYAELRRLDFVLSAPSSWALFDKAAGLCLLLTLYFEIMIGTFGTDPYVLRRLLLGLVIAMIYCAAVICALYARRMSQPYSGGDRPWSTYVAAGLAAGVCGLIGNLALQLFYERHILRALDQLRLTWPWALMACVTAMATIYNCDNDDKHGRRTVVLEAMGQASVMAATAVAVWVLLRALRCPVPGLPCSVPEQPTRLMVNAAFAGLAIGLLIPSWYRQQRKMLVDRAEPDDTEEMAA